MQPRGTPMPAISLSVVEGPGGGFLSGAVLASGGVSEVVAGPESRGWDAEGKFRVGAVEFAGSVDDVKERVELREVVAVRMLCVGIGNEDVK